MSDEARKYWIDGAGYAHFAPPTAPFYAKELFDRYIALLDKFMKLQDERSRFETALVEISEFSYTKGTDGRMHGINPDENPVAVALNALNIDNEKAKTQASE